MNYHHQFTHSTLLFTCSQLPLKTKKTWQTSHSSSSQRHNFLVTISSNGKVGRGEAGLPPKKPGCYLADSEDCFNFFLLFEKALGEEGVEVDREVLDVEEYFKVFKEDEEKRREGFYKVLTVLHSFKEPTYRAAISAIEFALFDLWSSLLHKPLLHCIYGPLQKIPFKSFIAISQGPSQILDATTATSTLPFIKLKFKDDFPTISSTLTHLIQHNIGSLISLISLDANASWSPATTIQVINFISSNNYQQKIYCLQQPFSVFPGEEWKDVYKLAKEKGVRIMADESFANGDDVEKVAEYSGAVNIKVEKAGGLLGAIRGLVRAKEAGMDIWLGMMIGSWLVCTQAFMLAPLATHGDLDAGEIVWSPYTKGFRSSKEGFVEAVGEEGMGVKEIKEKEDYI